MIYLAAVPVFVTLADHHAVDIFSPQLTRVNLFIWAGTFISSML